VLPSTS
jgi:hypothetical protein